VNFLAHIHIATYCKSDIAGNLLGDFVKGDPSGSYPNDIVNGIRLHRFVDGFTDQHEISKSTKMLFCAKHRRFSLIAMDVFWDHCLANSWSDFSHVTLDDFCKSSEMLARKEHVDLPERYVRVMELMWKNNWLTSYEKLENIKSVLERMSLRSHRMAPLADCFQDIENHYDEMRSRFNGLYKEVLAESRKKFMSLT